jgi:hypothetical protein
VEARKKAKGNAETPRTDKVRFRIKSLRRKARGKEPAWPGAAGEDGEVAAKGRRSFLRRGKEDWTITQKVLLVNVYLVCN